MIYSGLGFIVFVYSLICYVVLSEFIFNPRDQRYNLWVTMFLVCAILSWTIGKYLEKRRVQALADAEQAKSNILAWEKPSTLFFVSVKWWSLIFIIMLIYFMIYGYVPLLTGKG